MDPIKRKARIAGLWYLLLAITAIIGLIYMPSRIIVSGEASATVNNILANETLYRIGIASQLICQTLFVFLALALYDLFREVDKRYAIMLVALVVVAVPIAFLNELNRLAPLVILNRPDLIDTLDPAQANEFVMAFLDLYNNGIMIVEIFWGLWLLPFGLLAVKSGFIPKILGYLLILACIGYVVDSMTYLVIPDSLQLVSKITMVPESIGEFAMLLWLLIIGSRVSKKRKNKGELNI